MSDYHVFECERCRSAIKAGCGGDIPKSWSRLQVQFDPQAYSFSTKTIDLCGSCYTLVERLMRNITIELIDVSRYERFEKIEKESNA